MSTALEKLNSAWARISRLEQAMSVLSWDMETYMPPEGVRPRAEQMALLSELAHRWLVSDETGRLIEDAEAETRGSDHDSVEASLVRVARRDYDRKRKLPEELVARLTRTTALANSIWARARQESDFPAFAPILGELVEISREMASLLGSGGHPYDALLDLYEPDLTTADVERLFGDMKGGLVPLVKEITGLAPPCDTSFLSRKYDIAAQEAFGLRVLRDMKFDFNRGRQDRSAHPFTTSFTPYDVRITTRYSEDDLLSALFSTIHEAGHALYDMGLPLELLETPLCQPISLGVHESQSRLWENIVGRSRGFWTHYLPVLREHFPGRLDDVSIDGFYAAVNTSRPGLIRVESDELTYNLHIFIRFEIEKGLIAGTLPVREIPALWNDSYRDYLGIVPPDDARGCLQDIHWAHGSFGYFPTYSIGNLLSAQLYRAALAACPSIPGDIERGSFDALLGWLRDNVHRHGARYTAAELVRNITGGEMQVAPFINYLSEKFHGVYGR